MYQPRYVAYATAHSKTPDDMLAIDTQAYPGGCMTGFLIWIGKQLAKARKEHPNWFLNSTLVNHAEYDSWLQNEVNHETH